MSPYSTAFSAGSLLHKETLAVLSHVENKPDFMSGKEKPKISFVPVNSDASKTRLGREVTKRFQSLENSIFIDHFLNGSKDDQLLILFYAVNKTYTLINDFMLNVVLLKWRNLDLELDVNDFKNFFYTQQDKDPSLEKKSPAHILKISSVVVRMMKELGLLKNNRLEKRHYSNEILKLIASQGDLWFLKIVLLNELEINDLLS